jgi:hypothetical protein
VLSSSSKKLPRIDRGTFALVKMYQTTALTSTHKESDRQPQHGDFEASSGSIEQALPLPSISCFKRAGAEVSEHDGSMCFSREVCTEDSEQEGESDHFVEGAESAEE